MFRQLILIVMVFVSFFSFAIDESFNFNIDAAFLMPDQGKDFSMLTTKIILSTDIIFIENEKNKIKGDQFKDTGISTVASDELDGKEVHKYVLINNSYVFTNDFPGIALIISSDEFNKNNLTINKVGDGLVIKKDKKEYAFSLCNSQEGIHLYSKDNESKIHLYYSLGYEIQPTCSDDVYDY
jgi:hypothetical protein